ncbi:hypothetical protein CEK25_004154 [Fusarium fujikuroi]|nr:hypothetical protein CEK25_004154 [Fusarium fujikuroi]
MVVGFTLIDRLKHVPNSEPPLPSFCAVQHTDPLASLCYPLDGRSERGNRLCLPITKSILLADPPNQQLSSGTVACRKQVEDPRLLAERKKRNSAGSATVRSREELVRQFLANLQAKATKSAVTVDAHLGAVPEKSLCDNEEISLISRLCATTELSLLMKTMIHVQRAVSQDSDDEEIVNGAMRELREKKAIDGNMRREVSLDGRSGMLFLTRSAPMKAPSILSIDIEE